jgi:hypothetical protein
MGVSPPHGNLRDEYRPVAAKKVKKARKKARKTAQDVSSRIQDAVSHA